jgi:hypothetical protein
MSLKEIGYASMNWTDQLRIGTHRRLSENDNESSRSSKCWEFLCKLQKHQLLKKNAAP